MTPTLFGTAMMAFCKLWAPGTVLSRAVPIFYKLPRTSRDVSLYTNNLSSNNGSLSSIEVLPCTFNFTKPEPMSLSPSKAAINFASRRLDAHAMICPNTGWRERWPNVMRNKTT